MVHRLLQAIKQAAILGPLRLTALPLSSRIRAPRIGATLAAPTPRILASDAPLGRDTTDDWMFDAPESPLAPYAEGFSRELDRVSGALETLRTLLADMAKLEPAGAVPVNAVHVPLITATGPSDGFLFDDAGLPGLAWPARVVEGDAVFLFEDTGSATGLSVFDSPLTEKRVAA
ncbi:MAG: hypothetical protein AAGJ32_11775 [Pseudomonadota bacterium]